MNAGGAIARYFFSFHLSNEYSVMNAGPATRSSVPARLDALPWSGWHWRVVLALGVSWLLDGLEVTVVGSIGPSLQRPDTLGLSAGAIRWADSGARARTGRPGDQRQLLGRRGDGGRAFRLPVERRSHQPGLRLAPRLPLRRHSWPRHPARAPARAGEPTLAADAQPGRGSGAGGGGNRSAGRREGRREQAFRDAGALLRA